MRVLLRPQFNSETRSLKSEWQIFFSKLVITEQGRFNLQGVAAAAPAGAAVPAPSSAAASVPVVESGGLPIDLVIGATRLVNGRVDFSDRFIRPNYSAQLTELNGRLKPFRVFLVVPE